MLGAWIGTSLILALNVYLNFSAIDEMMKNQAGHWGSINIGPEHFRAIVIYLAGIENVKTYDTWEQIQIAIGLVVTALLFLEMTTRKLSAVPGVMTFLVLFLHFRVTPDLAWLHGLFAFKEWYEPSIPRNQFWRMHAVYESIDLIKCVMGVVVVGFVLSGQTTRHVRRRRHHRTDEPLAETDRRVASR